MKPLEIRFDDVLIVSHLTGSMKNSLRYNTFWGHFLEADKILQKYQQQCTLAVMSEGIDVYPDWVDYIRKNKDRYKIAVHAREHINFRFLYEEDGYRHLLEAKNKIEETFGPIERWYVPFGRPNFPPWGIKVCDQLGLKFHTRGGLSRHLYFHYWNSRDRDKLEKVLNKDGLIH